MKKNIFLILILDFSWVFYWKILKDPPPFEIIILEQCHFIIRMIIICINFYSNICNLFRKKKKKKMEAPGIDPGTSRMLSERSTI